MRARRALPGRVVAGLALLLTAALTPSAAWSAAPARQQVTPPGKGTAVQELGACLSANRTLDLLLLIDQSGSLRETDPDAVRVRAASYLLRQLARTAKDTEAEMSVAIAGFDATYQRTKDWGGLDDASLTALDAQLQPYAERNRGLDTDYAAALVGARDELRERSRNTGGKRCQALLWFSDGQFDVDVRRNDQQRAEFGSSKAYAPGVSLDDTAGVDAARSQGEAALCRDGGVADQIRAGGAVTLAVGLGDTVDFSLMTRLATGAGNRCGRPPTRTVGQFAKATDVDDLLFALDALGAVQGGATSTETGVCPRTACDQQHAFVLDLSIQEVHVLASAAGPGVDVLLRPPGGGAATTFRYSDRDVPAPPVGGQRITARWLTDRTLEVQLDRSAAATWPGQWSVVFVDPGGRSPATRARTQIRITGDLVPTVVGAPALVLRSGESAAVPLGLASEATRAAVVAAQVLGTATVDAQLRAADGSMTAIAAKAPPASLAEPFPLDLEDVAPGDATIELTLAVRTAGVPARPGRPAVPGTQLAERLVKVPVTVLPPLNYPVVDPRLDFGSVEGIGPLTSALGVTGPGCVWFDTTDVLTGPEGIGEVSLTSAAGSAGTCRELAVDEQVRLPFELAVAAPGKGLLSGTVVAHLVPADAKGAALTTPVAFSGDLTRPPDAGTRTRVFLLALLLGLGLPVAFLYVARRWSARMPGTALLAGLLEVEVEELQVIREGGPLTLTSGDLRFVPVPAPTRELSPVAGVVLHTRTGVNPTDAGWTEVRAPGTVVTTSRGNARLDLAVQGSWAALLDEPDLRRVRLLVLLPTAAGPPQLAELVRGVREDLPRQVAALRAAAGVPRERVGAAGASGFGSFGSFGSFGGDPGGGGGSPGGAGSLAPDGPPDGPLPSPPAPGAPPPTPPPSGSLW